jgi:D-sedoheptulose 7-phosphate isomerase
MAEEIRSRILSHSRATVDACNSFFWSEENIGLVEKFVMLIVDTFNGRPPGTIMIAGNGGSAADAQHMAAELVNKICYLRKALPAIALTTDTSILTAVANDICFEQVFARQVEGIGKPGDLLLVISTSGNSKNLIEAVRKAKEMDITTIGLLSKDGGELLNLVDLPIHVCWNCIMHAQEVFLVIEHIVCRMVEIYFREEVDNDFNGSEKPCKG